MENQDGAIPRAMKRHDANVSLAEDDSQIAQDLGPARRRDIGCRIAASCIWGAFIVLCLGLSLRGGFFVADDPCHALIAKCVARGIGYAIDTPSLDREPSEPLRFNPGVGTGPAVILPCAAVLRIAGTNDALPGISMILLWGSIITVLLRLVAREVTGLTMLLGTSVFCLTLVLVFAQNLFQWYTLLGEIPALAYLLLGHWLASTERISRRTSFLAGLFLGLAVQAKYLALLPCAGAFVILAVRLYADRQGWKASSFRLALFVLGCVTPTALWEAYKLACLGYAGYFLNWRQFVCATQDLTVRDPAPFSLDLVQKRLAQMITWFGVNVFGWTMMVVVALYLFRMRVSKRWPCLFVGLMVSSGCSFAYWLFRSMGWPRYAVMAVGLGCFALSVPVFGLPRVRQKILFTLVALVVLSPTISLLPSLWLDLREGLFRPSSKRIALAHAVAAIEELRRQGPIDLVARWPSEYWEVDFSLSGCGNFNRTVSDDQRPGDQEVAKRRIVLINRRWGVSFRERREVDERKDVEIQLGEKIATVLFSEGTFELVETCGPSPSAAVPVVKPAGAFITATPNPVPMDGSSFGISEIAWNTGDGNPGEVMLALRGHAEQPFYSSVPGDARGKKAADFLTAGTVYEFRLYAGKDRKRLLDKVRVTRSPQ